MGITQVRMRERADAVHSRHGFGDRKPVVCVPRLPELRALEGWYTTTFLYPAKQVKLSCKWNDMLRSAQSKHFSMSCFRLAGGSNNQILKYLKRPVFGVVMMLDKAGTVQCRSWVRLAVDDGQVFLKVSPAQGSGMSTAEFVRTLQTDNRLQHVTVKEAREDVYI